MTYLSEDPTVLAGGLLLLAGTFGLALRVTQQGKYLIRAVVALGLAVAVVAVEWLWVTDNERIEQVVYDLRRAVADSDVAAVLAHLGPNVQFLKGEIALSSDATRALIEANLSQTRFDLLRISRLQANAWPQSRRGTAEFQVFAKGTLRTSLATVNVGTHNSIWSLGFQEAAPGVWKVTRITPVQIPNGTLTMPGTAPPDGSRLGFHDDNGPSRPTSRSSLTPRRPGRRFRDATTPPTSSGTN